MPTPVLDAPVDALWTILSWLPSRDRAAARLACRRLHGVPRCGECLVLRAPPPPWAGAAADAWPEWLLAGARPARLFVTFARALGVMVHASACIDPVEAVHLGPALGLCEAHAALALWPGRTVVVASTEPYGPGVPPVSRLLRLASLVVACPRDAGIVSAWRPLRVTVRGTDSLPATLAALAEYGDGVVHVHASSGHGHGQDDAARWLISSPVPVPVRTASVVWTGAPTPLLDLLLQQGRPVRLRLASTDPASLCWRRWWPSVAAHPSLRALSVPALPPPRWLECVAVGLRSFAIEEACSGQSPGLSDALAALPDLRDVRVCCCCRVLRQLVLAARCRAPRRPLTVRFGPAPMGCGAGTPLERVWVGALESAVREPMLRVVAEPPVRTWPVPPGLADLIRANAVWAGNETGDGCA